MKEESTSAWKQQADNFKRVTFVEFVQTGAWYMLWLLNASVPL